MPRERTPGPGAYNLDVRPITPASPSYSIAYKPSVGGGGGTGTGTDGHPGPGTYSPKTPFSAGPAYTIPTKHGTSNSEHEKTRLPGPGAYNLGTPDLTHPKEPAFTLAGRRRSGTTDYGPGPGAYTLPKVESGPAHTIPGKRPASSYSSSASDRSPGPGSYTPLSNRPSSPAYTMATRSKKEHSQDVGPGPGTYQPRVPGVHAPAYSILGRWPAAGSSATTTPGPGSYQLDLGAALTHQRDPAFTISSRLHSKASSAAEEQGGGGGGGPGPGSYTPLHSSRTESGPAYTIATRKLSSRGEPTPGPGAYDAARVTTGSPAYSIAGRAPVSHAPPNPGPGAYNVKPAAAGPAFSIPRRYSSRRKSDTPGPASYCLGLDAVHTASPKFSMGTRHDEKGKELCPGPGSYELRVRSTAPAFSMSSGTPRFEPF